jgi:hypothetical protein
MSTKAVVVVVVVELVKVKVKVDQQCGWSSRTHLSIRKICAWNVELNWTPFYGTSGIVQIMPEEFMKGLRIVDSSRAEYLFGPIYLILAVVLPRANSFLSVLLRRSLFQKEEIPSEDLPSIDL